MKNARPVVTPRCVICDEETLTAEYGKFIVEPLERGYGRTLGNSLRRTLLSSVQGAAITALKIEGVLQEVYSIPGVYEDVTDIILNLKGMILKLHGTEPTKLYLDAEGPKDVTAADIDPNPRVEILNPDLHIARLEEEGKLEMEIDVNSGRGYVPAEMHRTEDMPIGTIPVDSIYSSIRKVNYQVEMARVEKITDYDRLILEIWTDGTVSPRDALNYAGRILRDHLAMFTTFDEVQEPVVEEKVEEREEVNPNLFKSVEELELSVRSYNCLQAAGIRTIAQLVQMTESELLKFRNFGKKSLQEIKEILDKMELHLGMELDNPEQFERAVEETPFAEVGEKS